MSETKTAMLGGGCFWCVEAVYTGTKGVIKAESGYSGGTVENPTYKEVCDGNTKHAEVVKITYDKNIISYEKLLDIFFTIHNPTTLNRQGNDVGNQYRSVIFYYDKGQKDMAQEIIKKEADKFENPIVTQVLPVPTFYKAELYHQGYFKNNPNQGYCVFVVKPKVDKFSEKFPNLKKQYDL